MKFSSRFLSVAVAIVSMFILSSAAIAQQEVPTTQPAVAQSAPARENSITIGTAGVTGVYYPAGGAICGLVKRSSKQSGLRCWVESTGGSIYNLSAVRERDLDLGIVQSDWQFHAYNGTALFERIGADKTLRSVFSLHSEPFTVVARRDANIHSFDDLKGKRVNVGDPGSGMRATMEELMRAKGWTMQDFSHVSEMKVAEQGKALCSNQIDAMVYAAGHPNGAIQEVTMACDVVLVSVEGPAVDALIKQYPFYAYATIPGGMYHGSPENVKTFGVKATLVANESVPEESIYQLVKSVFENYDTFKAMHPVFSTLDRNLMVTDGNTAPLHPGAERYYREVGLLK